MKNQRISVGITSLILIPTFITLEEQGTIGVSFISLAIFFVAYMVLSNCIEVVLNWIR